MVFQNPISDNTILFFDAYSWLKYVCMCACVCVCLRVVVAGKGKGLQLATRVQIVMSKHQKYHNIITAI